MPKVRLSGTIHGANDPSRKTRAKLLYRLYMGGWDIYNGNGDQTITLSNIQEKVIESDAFVFMPSPDLEDVFKAASIFVGFQTGDNDLSGKAMVLLNPLNSWKSFLALIDHLNEMGTVSQKRVDVFGEVERPKKVLPAIKKLQSIDSKQAETKYEHKPDPYVMGDPDMAQPEFSACVFCSASIKKDSYTQEGYDLGQVLAKKGWGCISGAGRTGIMGQVVAGAVAGGGWTGGSNVPHIIEMEGLPDGINSFWSRPDIYTRMEVMIEQSDMFIIMPGGMGTVQEFLALLSLMRQDQEIIKGKRILVYNRYDREKGKNFWDPLLDITKEHNIEHAFEVYEDFSEMVEAL